MILSHLTASLKALARGAALSTVLALPAAAATMQAVYTGTVTGSYDQTGVFGGPGSSLDGAAFTMTFRYDTTQGATDDGGYYQQLYGGAAYGTTSPFFYAALTINGVTQTLDLNYYSLVQLHDASAIGGTQTETLHQAVDYFDDGLTQDYANFYAYLGSIDGSLGVPLDLTQPFTADFDPLNGTHYGSGYFQLHDYDYGTNTYTEYAYGNLAPTRVVVTAVSAVPLPAGLPLLVFALGGLAVAARRRRATAA